MAQMTHKVQNVDTVQYEVVLHAQSGRSSSGSPPHPSLSPTLPPIKNDSRWNVLSVQGPRLSLCSV